MYQIRLKYIMVAGCTLLPAVECDVYKSTRGVSCYSSTISKKYSNRDNQEKTRMFRTQKSESTVKRII